MKTDDEYTWDDEDYIYPLTIVKDRYNGCYSGGAYTAWNLDAYNVPKEIDANDLDCLDFWSTYDGVVGKGATIEEAIEDLRNKLFHQDSVEYCIIDPNKLN